MRGLAEIVRLRTGECREAADTIAQIAADETDFDEKAAVHVAQCLRCQAEVAAYRRILRHLHGIRDDGIAPPVGSLAAVLAALEVASVEHNVGSPTWVVRAAYVGGITVVTAAAGAAGVMVWMSRRRLGLADTG